MPLQVSLSDSTQSFASSALVLTPVSTPPGHNDIGMVAWRATLKTPDAPSGRQVVVVANDITFQAGTFGPKEDAVFRAAVEESLSRRVPVLYVAANAGARVGLAEEVKALVKVSTKGAGVDYLYLDDADYRSLLERAPGTVQAEAVDVDGQRRWRLTAVVGAGDGLGVECLSGAGATASVFSKAWDEGLTFTLVSGRSIGIGAYLARLGRRCAQRSCQPIILTGFQALNKLLQRQVSLSGP